MSTQIVVALAVILAGLGFFLLAASALRRRAGATAGPSGARIVQRSNEPGPPPPTIAPAVPDSPEVAVNRRMFMNRTWLLAMSVFGVAFGGTSVGMLWPNKVAGFGGKVDAGKVEDLKAAIENDGRVYNAVGRFYIVGYPHTAAEANRYVEAGVAKDGLMTLYQKCAHLGCRVPYCDSSQWFECPCHGSKYNGAGEVMAGSPAPAGLWRFKMEITDGRVIVDTGEALAQPELGTDTIFQPPTGAHCIASAEGAEH